MSRRGIPETVRLVHEQEDLITDLRDLRRQLAAAEARALTAEHEIEVVRAEQQARRDRATARAERAETEARAGAKLYVAATARAERAEAEHRMCSVTEAKLLARVKRAESDVEELRGQRDFAMRELRAKIEAYDALSTDANRRLLRMAIAEAIVQRVRNLAERYKAEWQDNNGGQYFSACYDDLLAALDSTDPEPAPMFDEAALLARQRDDVLARCAAREADGCTYIRIADLYEALLHDPADPVEAAPEVRGHDWQRTNPVGSLQCVHCGLYACCDSGDGCDGGEERTCPGLADVLAGRAPGPHDDSTCGWCARLRIRFTCGLPGLGNFDGPQPDCSVHGKLPDAQRPEERSDEPVIGKITPDDLTVAAAITNATAIPVRFDPAPERSDEGPNRVTITRRPDGAHEFRIPLSDAGLPADGEERKP